MDVLYIAPENFAAGIESSADIESSRCEYLASALMSFLLGLISAHGVRKPDRGSSKELSLMSLFVKDSVLCCVVGGGIEVRGCEDQATENSILHVVMCVVSMRMRGTMQRQTVGSVTSLTKIAKLKFSYGSFEQPTALVFGYLLSLISMRE